MTTCDHTPDPGRERATALLIAAFSDERHRKGSVDPKFLYPGEKRSRECLGCGHSSPGGPGWFQCYGGGPRLYEICFECAAETGIVWEYRIPWERFYRLIAPSVEGQLALFEEAS